MERLTEKITNKDTGEVLAYRLKSNVSRIQADKKLGEYEDAEEQGLLIRIPCRVGDYVYYVTENKRVVETFVHRTIIHDGYAFLAFADGKIMYSYDFGKTVFLTLAEAEKALAEMGE